MQKRTPYEGVLNIVRFNWNYYLTAATLLLVGGGGLYWAWPWLATWMPAALARLVATGLVMGLAVAAYFLVASLVVSHWVYDRAPLYRWQWLPAFLGREPRRALNVHAGLDETSEPLGRAFPRTAWQVADFYDPTRHTEASIARARRRYPATAPFDRVSPAQLPYPDQRFDAVLVLFAAHEIRDAAERAAFFAEIRRVLTPGGALVLVEHARDWANFAAFGPGFTHFLPAGEWLRRAAGAGLTVEQAERHTPFVRAWKMTRHD